MTDWVTYYDKENDEYITRFKDKDEWKSMDFQQKYFDETEDIYSRGLYWQFTKSNLSLLTYHALYSALRELGLNEITARGVCSSKWIRRNEDLIQNELTRAFLKIIEQQSIEGILGYARGYEDPPRGHYWKANLNHAKIMARINGEEE